MLLSPFDMNGVGPDKVHLVYGFRHHLIACLVRFREWIVADNPAQVSLPSNSAPSTLYSIDATAYQIETWLMWSSHYGQDHGPVHLEREL